LIGRFWLILDTFKNGYSSLNAAHSVNIARKYTGRISKSKLDNTECNARSSRVVALLAFKLKQIKQVNFFLRHPVYIYIGIFYIYEQCFSLSACGARQMTEEWSELNIN
jgi:hypothetical protein